MGTKRLRVHTSSPWARWTPELESEVARFAQELAASFGHRVRWTEPEREPRFWRASGFIPVRSLREGEEMRREGLRLARARGLNVYVEF